MGKTLNLIGDRLRSHRNSKQSSLPVHRWLRKHGDVEVVLLEEVASGGDWSARERYWIQECVKSGCCLNIAKGGEGAHFVTRTPEHLAKIAKALEKYKTGWDAPCQTCGRTVRVTPKNGKKYCSLKCHGVASRGVSKPQNRTPEQQKRAINAAAAARRARTHCIKGHELSGANLRINRAGSRVCKTCQREHVRRARALGRAEAETLTARLTGSSQ